MKIVIAPDSFKGSLSAAEVCAAIEKGIKKAGCVAGVAKTSGEDKTFEVVKIPMADGGEGTVEAIVSAVGGRLVCEEVTGPLGEKLRACFGILDLDLDLDLDLGLGGGRTAVIEMAAASGLTLVPPGSRNPLAATSYGTGGLIRMALHSGCDRLIIGIGGSATNDGGMGMAQALGIRFLDTNGQEVGFGGQYLEEVQMIDLRGLDPLVHKADIKVACDVANPLCGKQGAAYVYGPQKGATPEMVKKLDYGLIHFAKKIKQHTGKDIKDVPGAGAAGGMGAGLMAFLGARLMPGIEIISEITGLEKHIQSADLVFTGEGRTDRQTAYGKVASGIASLAKKHGVPLICLSGSLGEGIDSLYEHGITAFFSIAPGPMSLDDAMQNAGALLQNAAENIMRLRIS